MTMTDPEALTTPPDPPADLSRIADDKIGEAVGGARRVRNCARLVGLALALGCALKGGPDWFLGAALGWLVVEINLSLLVRTLARSPRWRGRSLRPTLAWFYLTFGATGLACLLIIRNGWGHPLAFLLGLLTFFFGLVLGLVSLAVKKAEPRP